MTPLEIVDIHEFGKIIYTTCSYKMTNFPFWSHFSKFLFFLQSEERFFCQNCIVNTFIYGELTLEISCFSVCFGLSGYFYYQVGRTLKTGRQNSRTRTLSSTFIALWSCWGICAVPNMVFYTWFRTSSNLNSFVESSKFITPSDFAKDMMTTGGFQILWYDKINQFIVYGDIAFRALRHSYSSINSLLLIILLRPFQRPMQQIMSKMLYICRRIFQPKKLIKKNWAKFVKSQFIGLGVELADGGLADNQKMRFQPYCKPIVTDQ